MWFGSSPSCEKSCHAALVFSHTALCNDTLLALRELRDQIALNILRPISGRMSDHVHIYVDASFDLEGYSGVGGVLYDSSGQACFFFSEELSCDFLCSVKKAEQKNLIQELDVGIAHLGRTLAPFGKRKTCRCLLGQRIRQREFFKVMVAE